ncbi:MAG: hypothetical protein PHU85_19410, partial [Phycisphaerae bacterium]|nr:hypothetical protein [Phycisphaerae bacterium]
LLAIGNQSRSYRIQTRLQLKQYKEATGDLLELIAASPKQAEPLTDEVLSVYEKEYKQLLADGNASRARERAEQAEQFAGALTNQAEAKGSLPPEALTELKIRWSRTLNWKGDFQKAFDVLNPLYKARPDEPTDKEKADIKAYTRDPDLLVELGTALLGLKRFGEARRVFDPMVFYQTELFPPMPIPHCEVWWRALIGQNECFLETGEQLAGAYRSLKGFREMTEIEAANQDPSVKDSPKLPPWLLGRYQDVLNRLEEKEDVKKAIDKVSSRPDHAKAAPVVVNAGNNVRYIVTLVLACAGGLGLFLVIGIIRGKQAKKNRVIIRKRKF